MEKKLSIYDITSEYNYLYYLIEEAEGDITGELEEWLKSNAENAENKARSLIYLMENFKMKSEYLVKFAEKKLRQAKFFQAQIIKLEGLLEILIKTYGAVDEKSKAKTKAIVWTIAEESGDDVPKTLKLKISYTEKVDSLMTQKQMIEEWEVIKNYCKANFSIDANSNWKELGEQIKATPYFQKLKADNEYDDTNMDEIIISMSHLSLDKKDLKRLVDEKLLKQEYINVEKKATVKYD